MSTVIQIENLYKEYRLGVIGHGTLYRDLQSWWSRVRGKEDPNSLIGQESNGRIKDHILALTDINLEVTDGEVLGIIGANGAGKSTLLKILSRVTAPTKGSIKVKGRIASMLEVGTGFHTELTGRENIYLNGAINGMDKREIAKKLDEIVDFAGVEQFIDTPVKRYSSGMFVRLGFAVAAYLDPDILVVDEVLAVGDASFQKKAIGKMKDVSKSEGRTVLFVSHNMESIKKLCARSILLEKGKVIFDGPTNKVIESYLKVRDNNLDKYIGERKWDMNAPNSGYVKYVAIRTKNEKGEIKSVFDVSDDVYLEIDYFVLKTGYQCALFARFGNKNTEALFLIADEYIYGPWGKQSNKSVGMYRAVFFIPKNLLNPGRTTVTPAIFIPPNISNSQTNLLVEHALSFEIVDELRGLGAKGNYPYDWGSYAVRPFIKCETTFQGNGK
jgi:lipopolysaccharide transport system ATP-binding protein